MKRSIIAFMRNTPLGALLARWEAKGARAREMVEWEARGKPMPPPHLVKQQVLLDYAARFDLKILVETGTYLGDMVEACRKRFDRIYSIELSPELCEKARARFRKYEHITIICGDSGVEIKTVMTMLDQPALFWLDGHYSAGITARGRQDTPILEELDHIFRDTNNPHVIIIDDARCFVEGTPYPGIDELQEYVRVKRPDVDISIDMDSIRITPQEPPGCRHPTAY